MTIQNKIKEKDSEISKLKQDLEIAKNKQPEKVYIKEIVKEEVHVNKEPKNTNQIENESEVSASELEVENPVKIIPQKTSSPKLEFKDSENNRKEEHSKSPSSKEIPHKVESASSSKEKVIKEETKGKDKSPIKFKNEKELKYAIYQLKMKMNEKNMEVNQFVDRVIFESNHTSENIELQTIIKNLKKFMAYSRPEEIDDFAIYLTQGNESTNKGSISQIISSKLKYIKFDINSGIALC